MNGFSSFVVDRKYIVIVIFAVFIALSIVMSALVNVNFNLTDYLPKDAESTEAIEKTSEYFDESIPNLSVYVRDISITEAKVLGAELEKQSGVKDVIWLGDVVDIEVPIDNYETDLIESWYKEGGALFRIVLDTGNLIEDLDAIKAMAGEDSIMAGDAVNLSEVQRTTGGEIPKIMMFVVPLVLLILLLTTSSWLEPLLFLITIGTAILINEGTNLFLGEVSFLTRSTSAVLQLAVSMDYAVFLLHRFAVHRHAGHEVHYSMKSSVRESFSVIAASAATTVFGFLALTLMRFRIGPDLGLVLGKAILISFITVMTLLPALGVAMSKQVDKLHHKSLIPDFTGFSRFVGKVCIPLALIMLMIIPIFFMAQGNNDFIYGSSGMQSEGSEVMKDSEMMDELFGRNVQMALVFPSLGISREKEMVNELKNISEITDVQSYVTLVSEEVPEEFINEDEISYLRSDGYSRIIISLDTPYEGELAFEAVKKVRETADKYYEENYLVGQTVVNKDLRDTIIRDNKYVRWSVALAIGIVLLLTFRSIVHPVMLLLAIQGATWINLGMPYFTGTRLNYVGYLIISAVQLGATVDYGILLTSTYKVKRRTMSARDSVIESVRDTTASILTPASILIIAGLMLGFISSNGIVSQMGAILGRGAAISAFMVLVVLPGLLVLTEKFERKNLMKKKVLSVLVILALAASSALTFADATKDEAIYVNLSGDGSVKYINIVNSFTSEKAKEITDYGYYEKVIGLTSLDHIDYSEGEASFIMEPGVFSYQGTLTKNETPWDFEIKFYLGGKDLPLADLPGAEGELEIDITITDNAAYPDFTENYALQLSMSFDSEKAALIDDGGASVVLAGGKRNITYTRLPGSTENINIKLSVNDFEMDPVDIVGVPLKMSIELPNLDEMESGLDEMASGISELKDGTGKLESASYGIYKGTEEFSGGLYTLSVALLEASKGSNEIIGAASEFSAVFSGASALSEAVASLETSSQSASAMLLQLASAPGMEVYADGLKGASSLLDAYRNIGLEISEVGSAGSSYDSFVNGLKSYGDGISSVSDGLGTLYENHKSLKTGTKQLYSGVRGLYEGMTTLSESVTDESGQMKEEVEKIISEYNYSDYEVKSFASSRNENLQSVQFIYRTEPVKKEKKEIIIEETEVEKTVFERFLDLFRKK